MNLMRIYLFLMCFALAVPPSTLVAREFSKQELLRLWPIWRGNRTTSQVLQRYGDIAKERLKPHFDKAGVAYPPSDISLVSLKQERRLELWAKKDGRWVHVVDYPILGASGHSGPKLRQGDRQVPEGIYQVTQLNPNSNYHLSMRINYPNRQDHQYAQRDNRGNLGGDIFIHGTSYSIGCIAVGDPAIQDLYVLTAAVGMKHVNVIIAPYDFRLRTPAKLPRDPAWVTELYAEIKEALAQYIRPKSQANPTKKRGDMPSALRDLQPG